MASSPPTQGQELYDDARQDLNPHLGPKRPALSQEEVAILRECNRESFWYRCVPFSIAFVGGASYLTHAGILKANTRYGLLFKNMGACLLGYIVGKVSYQGQCRQKILERAPNSALARTMRGDKTTPESNIQFYPEIERDAPVKKATFRDTDVGEAHPTYKDLDDTQRPSLDREIRFSDIKTEEGRGSDSSSMSYDDLRKKHRAEFDAKMATSPQHPMRQPPFPPPRGGPYQEAEPSMSSRPPTSGASPRRNQYGDAME